MLVKIGQSLDHGFDAPLGLLSDCHRRIEHFLKVLVTVADVRRGAALLPADRRILEAALHYFRTAAPRHSADEEQSLFPRLRRSTDPAAVAALERLDALEADHREAEDHHDAVDVLARRWMEEGTLGPGDARSLREHLVALERLYRRHIAVEDHELFPAAGRLLTPVEIAAVGREMAARRNISPAWELLALNDTAAPDGSSGAPRG
jgi:hemerythrin-like domain-containing protein